MYPLAFDHNTLFIDEFSHYYSRLKIGTIFSYTANEDPFQEATSQKICEDESLVSDRFKE